MRPKSSELIEKWQSGRLVCELTWTHRQDGKHFCGYVTLPEQWFREEDYGGFLVHVPVHKGITYKRGLTYGFDCDHSGDREPDSQTHSMEWARAETQRFADWLTIARKYEAEYLLAWNNKEKAEIISRYTEECNVPD